MLIIHIKYALQNLECLQEIDKFSHEYFYQIMKNLGEILLDFRIKEGLPIRTIAAFLETDPAILSKMERGQRKIPKDQVLKLAEYFKADKEQLKVSWLCDKIVFELQDEELALKALRAAESKIKDKKKINRK